MFPLRHTAITAGLLLAGGCAELVPAEPTPPPVVTASLDARPIAVDDRFVEPLQVTREFVGRFDEDGNLEIETITPAPAAGEGLRTAQQALSFCNDLEIHGGDADFRLDTLAGTSSQVPEQCIPYEELLHWGPLVYDEGGTICATVRLTSALPVRARNTYVEIVSITPGYEAYRYHDVPSDDPPCCGNGAALTYVDHAVNAPTDLNGGLFEYGPLSPGDSIDARWIFRRGGGAFEFRGRVVARIDEVPNGRDDDCDGRVDDSLQLYPAGAFCHRDQDCASMWCLDNNCL